MGVAEDIGFSADCISPEEFPMAHAAQTKAEAASKPPDEVAPPPQSPKPESQPPETVRKPGAKGALFRALVDGGADAMVAYNAEEGTKSMVSEAVATQVQPILVEMRQMFAAQERRFDALERRFDAQEQRFDAQERRLDALTAEVQRVNEVVDVKLDGIRREMRLIWGALGISLTVWLVVLGYLLTN